MWWQSPEFWTAFGSAVVAVGGLLKATRAKTRADDAHQIAVGHALDRSWHPNAPRPVGIRRPPAGQAGPPSSPAGPSSG